MPTLTSKPQPSPVENPNRLAEKLRRYLDVGVLKSLLTKTHADRGRERYRRVGIAASTALLSKALTIVISFVSVPLTVHYLGAERYGVWLTISSLLTWMALSDFGIAGNALVNVLSEAHGRNDRESARQFVSSAFWTLTVIALGIGLILLLTFNSIPWRALLRVSMVMSDQELRMACALTLSFFVVSIPLSLLNSVYTAYQEGYVANTWGIASNLFALASLIAVARSQGGLPQLILALSGTRVAIGVANFYSMSFRRYYWLTPAPSAVRWTHIKRLLKLGVKYMVTQLGSLGLYQSQPMLITQVLGPASVVTFVVAQKILTRPVDLAYMATAPFVSAFGEAKARGDWHWIRTAFRNSTLACAGLGILVTIALMLAAVPLIRIWAGPTAVPGPVLILWLGVYTLSAVVLMPGGQMMSGLERVNALAVSVTLSAIGVIGLGIPFARWWGLGGVALALAVSKILAFLPIQVYEVRRTLRMSGFRAPQLAEGQLIPAERIVED
jgi:O-antigen/teichoic acid export membrane protein